jgi:hypothetical protein
MNKLISGDQTQIYPTREPADDGSSSGQMVGLEAHPHFMQKTLDLVSRGESLEPRVKAPSLLTRLESHSLRTTRDINGIRVQ